MRFVYSVVRFVPDPARGEFINVGAIVGSEESSEWQVRQIENPIRARAFDDRKSLDAVWTFLGRIGSQIDAFDLSMEQLFEPDVEPSEEWLNQLHYEHRNIVQLSPPTPMVAASAEEALDRVFELVVLDPVQRRYPFRRKHIALAAVRRAYKQHSIRPQIGYQERVRLETDHHRERFDFAVVNGKVLQLAQTWSFQVPDQEGLAEQIKAWGWTVQEARHNGGRVVSREDLSFEVTTDVDIEVVYVPPAEDQLAPAFNDALNVFDALNVRHTSLEGAIDVGQRAEDLLVKAGVGRLDLNRD